MVIMSIHLTRQCYGSQKLRSFVATLLPPQIAALAGKGESVPYQIDLPEIGLGVLLLGILQYLVTLWISSRFKASLQKENAKFLEKLKWEFKVREQAAKVAEYMSLARNLKKDSSEEDYRKANTLSWELAMWLPDDVYKSMGNALSNPDDSNNPLSVVIAVRKVLLDSKAGDLTSNDVIHHAPEIGK
jgi:hypothetical protein